METFQAKEDTTSKWEAKKGSFKICQEIKVQTHGRGLEGFLFTDECPKYLFQYPNPENNIVWGSQECDVPPAYQAKQSAKVIVWGGMTGRGLTRLVHILPSGQTLTSEYSCQRDSRKWSETITLKAADYRQTDGKKVV